MQHVFRSASLIVLAMLASAVLLAGLIKLTTDLTIYVKTPADFLPAETTVLLHHPSKDGLFYWSELFPVLKALPPQTYDAIGIVTSEDAKTAAIGFTESKTPKEQSVGSFAITVTQEDALKALRPATTLADTAQYAHLAEAYTEADTWTYATLPHDTQNSTLAESVLTAIVAGTENAAGITMQENSVSITTVDARRMKQQIARTVPHVHNRAFMLALANGKASWDLLHSNLPTAKRLIVEGLMREMLFAYGDDLSIHHDLFALLQQPGSVQMTATGSHVGILISGQHRDAKQLHRILDRFHTAFLGTLPATKVTKRVLDSRFNSVDIRHDTSLIADWQERVDGWLLRGTVHHKQRSGLFSAVANNAFMMSTNEDLIRKALGKPSSTFPAETDGLEVAIAQMHAENMHVVLEKLHGDTLLPSMWLQQDITLHTTMKNGMRKVRIQGSDTPLHLIKSLF